MRPKEERAERQQADELVDAIIDATASRTGEAFFGAFARVLSRLFRCRYVFVCEHLDMPVTRVRTLAFCDRGELLDNVEYDVASGPCEETASGDMVFYPSQIQRIFPNDHDLVSMEAESYCGIPLFDQAQHLLGHLAIMDDRPMALNICNYPALGVFINRVATELAHRRAEIERRRAEEERFQLEVQLRQARKMEALGNLAGGVAHEFNNILASIFGYVEMARLELPAESSQVTHLDHVLIAATRAKELVQKILTFSRQSTTTREPVPMNQIVNETLELLQAAFPATIDLHVQVRDDAGSVMADRAQLQEVVMNLCTNAEYAMRRSGGRLHIALAATEADEGFAASHPPLKAGPCVCLTVQDTGLGIAPDMMERIYEPFFTTKPVGEGTGMGLAIVHGIVVDHGGAMSVTSRPGEGSTFQVYLPQVRPPARAKSIFEASIPHGEGHIMVVDDELLQAELLALQLKYLGYDVESVVSSQEALCRFRAAPDNYDLVITDQTMPEMTGEHLVKALHQIRPDLPVILLTGFSHLIDKDKARELGIDTFLMKPLTIEQIADAVHRVLDGQTQ